MQETLMRIKIATLVATTLIIGAVFTTSKAYAWGQNGHRIVGHIAEQHLSDETVHNLLPLLEGQSLAQISTWADEMRSSPELFWRKKSSRWHYINLPKNKTLSLNHAHTHSKDDVTNILEGIYFSINTLQSSTSSLNEKQFALKFLGHLVGDSHQPFHAGRSEDRGGNLIKVDFFDNETNLHSLWDTGLIENENLAYTEYAKFIDTDDAALIKTYLNSSPTTWLMESHKLAEDIYTSTSDEVSYSYVFKYNPLVKQRLQKAGVRLAGVLNYLFDSSDDNKKLKITTK